MLLLLSLYTSRASPSSVGVSNIILSTVQTDLTALCRLQTHMVTVKEGSRGCEDCFKRKYVHVSNQITALNSFNKRLAKNVFVERFLNCVLLLGHSPNCNLCWINCQTGHKEALSKYLTETKALYWPTSTLEEHLIQRSSFRIGSLTTMRKPQCGFDYSTLELSGSFYKTCYTALLIRILN